MIRYIGLIMLKYVFVWLGTRLTRASLCLSVCLFVCMLVQGLSPRFFRKMEERKGRAILRNLTDSYCWKNIQGSLYFIQIISFPVYIKYQVLKHGVRNIGLDIVSSFEIGDLRGFPFILRVGWVILEEILFLYFFLRREGYELFFLKIEIKLYFCIIQPRRGDPPCSDRRIRRSLSSWSPNQCVRT